MLNMLCQRIRSHGCDHITGCHHTIGCGHTMGYNIMMRCSPVIAGGHMVRFGHVIACDQMIRFGHGTGHVLQWWQHTHNGKYAEHQPSNPLTGSSCVQPVRVPTVTMNCHSSFWDTALLIRTVYCRGKTGICLHEGSRMLQQVVLHQH